MKKSIFFIAALSAVTLCTTSCSSDDENNPYVPQEVVISEPATAEVATAFTIPATQQPTATVGTKTAKVQEVNIAESGKTVVKVDVNGEAKYVTYDSKFEKKNDKGVYTLTKAGVYKGTIELTDEVASPRMRSAGAAGNLIIKLIIEIPDDNGNVITFDVPETNTQAEPVQETVSQGTNTINICRTWVIEQMTLTLKDNKIPGKSKITDFTLTEKSSNLKPLADKAQDNNAGLTDDEYDELCKAILGITLDKTGKLSLEYSTGLTDACLWNWANSDQTTVKLTSTEGEEFGNKFLNEKSKITVIFWASPDIVTYPNGIAHFIITTTVDTATKNYDATIDLQVK
jgi:hypothetical protein